eukprot:1174471-Amorphochlora_amoeboformis.AAC.1
MLQPAICPHTSYDVVSLSFAYFAKLGIIFHSFEELMAYGNSTSDLTKKDSEVEVLQQKISIDNKT